MPRSIKSRHRGRLYTVKILGDPETGPSRRKRSYVSGGPNKFAQGGGFDLYEVVAKSRNEALSKALKIHKEQYPTERVEKFEVGQGYEREVHY